MAVTSSPTSLSAPTPGATARRCWRRLARCSPSRAWTPRWTTWRGAPTSVSAPCTATSRPRTRCSTRSPTSCSRSSPRTRAQLLELDDPWEAFTQAMWFGGEKTAGDRAFTEILAAARPTPRSCPGKEDLQVTVGEMMRRCIAAGPDAARRDDRGHPAADVRRRQRQRDASTRAQTPGAGTSGSCSTACGPRPPAARF